MIDDEEEKQLALSAIVLHPCTSEDLLMQLLRMMQMRLTFVLHDLQGQRTAEETRRGDVLPG
jgi:hypothetical protein